MHSEVQERVRAVARVTRSTQAPVGTFTVRRALPERERHAVGPWVFLDHFGPFRVKPGHDGVGAHPHAGIETVTYLLSGRQEHRDSSGGHGIVSAGGAQWMSAGRGVVHAESALVERDEDAMLHGVQLWTSLPRALKLMAPAYQRIAAESIPEHRRGGARVRLIAGELDGRTGPARTVMPLVLAHVSITDDAPLVVNPDSAFEMAAYVISGRGHFGADSIEAATGELAIFEAGGAVRLARGGDSSLELMLLGGAPAEGPLVFHGPFVMNSVEQVRAAEIAWRTGRMGELGE